jgi:hypothetical protein
MDERKSWAIKEEAVLDDLVALMDLTDADRSILVSYQDKAKEVAPLLVEAFYGRVLHHEPTAEYVGDKVEHLKDTLTAWFIRLFSGQYDHEYVKARLQIGKVHVRIGLPVRYPLAMMDVMLKYGHEATSDSLDAQLAFSKLLALDIAVFNQAYEDTQLKHLAEMVGNERLARRLLTQEATEV